MSLFSLRVLQPALSTTATTSSTPESTSSSANLSTTAPTPTPPNALALLSTSSALLKAQTTKLSLLSLNKPFTPTAITSTLKTLPKIFPSLVAGAQMCIPPIYPELLSADVRGRTKGLLLGMEKLIGEVSRISNAGEGGTGSEEADVEEVETGPDNEGHQKVLRGTGVIWEDCDWIVKLGEKGVAAWAAERVKWWGELVGDALEELESWAAEGEEAQEEEDEDTVEEARLVNGLAKATLKSSYEQDVNKADKADKADDTDDTDDDDPFSSPPPSASIRPSLKKSTALISLLRLLFPPLLKRRISRFPALASNTPATQIPSAENCIRLNALVETCRFFSEEIDELAAALYAGDKAEVEKRLKGLGAAARKGVVGEAAAGRNWQGGEDEFTAWCGKWLVRLEEVETS